MSIERITHQFDIKESGPFVVIYGNTIDQFILPHLKIVNLDQIFYYYFKDKAYNNVIFIDPESVEGVYTYDLPSIKSLNLGSTVKPEIKIDKEKELKLAGFQEDKHWTRKKFPKSTESSLEKENKTNIKKDELGRYYAKVRGGRSVIEILDQLIKQKISDTIFFFTQFNQLFTRTHELNEDILIDFSQKIENWRKYIQDTNTKFIFNFINCYSENKIKEYLDSRNLESLKSIFEADGTTIRKNSKIYIRIPGKDEIKNLLQRKRLSSGWKIEWLYLDKIVNRLHDTDYRLIDLNQRVNNLKSLSYNEFVKEQLIVPLEINVNKQEMHKALSIIRGQDDNVDLIIDKFIFWAIQEQKESPLNFFLVGSSGVGKTFTAKTLQKALEPQGYKLKYLAMNEFAEEHNHSRLFGAPPGYVGYEGVPELLNAIRESPRLVIIFDEIEKAHNKILIDLMQLLDEGIVQFANGEEKNFKECIIFFTSNLEREKVIKTKIQYLERDQNNNISSQAFQNELREIVKLSKDWPPEVIGRIQNFIVFDPVSGRDLIEITIKNILNTAKKQGIKKIEMDPQEIAKIAISCENSPEGMRALKREIDDWFMFRNL